MVSWWYCLMKIPLKSGYLKSCPSHWMFLFSKGEELRSPDKSLHVALWGYSTWLGYLWYQTKPPMGIFFSNRDFIMAYKGLTSQMSVIIALISGLLIEFLRNLIQTHFWLNLNLILSTPSGLNLNVYFMLTPCFASRLLEVLRKNVWGSEVCALIQHPSCQIRCEKSLSCRIIFLPCYTYPIKLSMSVFPPISCISKLKTEHEIEQVP